MTVSIVALFPIASLAQTLPGDAAPTNNCLSLSYNMGYRVHDTTTNGEVSDLQDFLNTQGYLSVQPSGYLGLMTVAAVRNFQASVGLSSTGYVGPLTRGKIQDQTCKGNSSNANIIRNVPVITSVSPTINSVSPNPAMPGSTITLSGSYFKSGSFVTFNDGSSYHITPITNTDSTISFMLPLSMSMGNHTVVVVGPDNVASNQISLSVNSSVIPDVPAGYGYVYCGYEGQRCWLPGGGAYDVIYGTGGGFTYKNNVTSYVDCNTEAFGNDPAYLLPKYCFYKPASAPVVSPVANYTLCAKETQFCSFSGTATVAYGWNDGYVYKTGVTGGIQCDNSVFGDPKFGFNKSCYILTTTSAPSITSFSINGYSDAINGVVNVYNATNPVVSWSSTGAYCQAQSYTLDSYGNQAVLTTDFSGNVPASGSQTLNIGNSYYNQRKISLTCYSNTGISSGARLGLVGGKG